MPSGKKTVRAYLTAEEHETISKIAAKAGLSASNFVKDICLGREMELDFAKALGFEEHQRHAGVHINTANIHLHIAFNAIVRRVGL